MPYIQMSSAPLTNPSCHQDLMLVISVSNLKWAMFSIWKRHVTRIWWQWNWFPISSLLVWRVLKSKGALRAPNMLLSPPKSTVRWQLRIFSYIYIYIYIYLDKYIYTHVYIHVYMFICICIRVYIYISIYVVCIYIFCTTKFYCQVTTVHISVYICIFEYM